MEERLPDRIKRHFRENKKLYLGVLIGVATAGITLAIMKTVKSRAILRGGVDWPVKGATDLTQRSRVPYLDSVGADCPVKESTGFVFNNSPLGKNNVLTNNVYTGGPGHPGFITRCIDTGELFQTQGAAARAFDIPDTTFRRHLNQGVPLDSGLNFERLGVFN